MTKVTRSLISVATGILLFIIGVSIVLAAPGDDAELSITPHVTVAQPGDLVTVTITLEDMNVTTEEFAGWNVALAYNPAMLQVADHSLNSAVWEGSCFFTVPGFDNSTPGRLDISETCVDGNSGANLPYELGTVVFTVTNMGGSSFDVLTETTPANDTVFNGTDGTDWAPAIITETQVTAAPDVQFSSATYEVDEGVGTATITATLNPTSTQYVTVSYATSDGTATVADGDYNAASGQWVFNPGEQQKTFDVTIIDDDIEGEPDETVNLTLSSPENANLGTPNPATLTILDNDCAPVSGLNFTYDPASPLVNDTVTFTGSVTGGTPIIHLGLTLAGRARRAARTLTLSPIPPLAPSPSRWTWRMSTAMIARRST